MPRPIHAVILAGGEGKRMKSAIPKVLIDVLGRPVIGHVLDALRPLKPESVVVVGGGNLPRLRAALADEDRPALGFVRQAKPLGTAHAAKQALKLLPKTGADVLILCGDAPLITTASLRAALRLHRRKEAQVTVLTARVPEPAGLGRIVRDARGRFLRIVEEKDASEDERAIDEVNAGQYAVRIEALRRLLPKIGKLNAQGEYYLTDLVSLAGGEAVASPLDSAEEARGINRPQELREARALLRERILQHHLARGVDIADPALTLIETGVKVGAGTLVEPFVLLRRGVSIPARCVVQAHSDLKPNVRFGDRVSPRDGLEPESPPEPARRKKRR